MNLSYKYIGTHANLPMFLACNFQEIPTTLKAELKTFIHTCSQLKESALHWGLHIEKVTIIAIKLQNNQIKFDFDLDVNLSKYDKMLIEIKKAQKQSQTNQSK